VSRAPRRRGLFAGTAVVLGVFAYLLYGGIDQNLVYFLTPTELLARGPTVYGTPVRLGGDVRPGSVSWDADALHLAFHLTDGDREIPVHSRGAPPVMFRDGMGVVVEGKLNPAGIFESSNLMVMHSNEYREAESDSVPAERYHHLPRR
jgi:cytochrome c-type biogenesis protein CcmE